MTNEEAIKQLEFDKEMILFNPNNGEHQTIEQVKIHNEDNYNAYIADCKAIEALEKQIPKKPVLDDIQHVRYTMNYKCTACGGKFTGRGFADYCYHCGQKLDWGGEHE